MNRRTIIILVLVLLIGLLSYPAWLALRPYSSQSSDSDRAEISQAKLTRDESFFWLDLQLQGKKSLIEIDYPIFLIGTRDIQIDVAETIIHRRPDQSINTIKFKFWLDRDELSGPLSLQFGADNLEVRTRSLIPRLENNSSKTFRTSAW